MEQPNLFPEKETPREDQPKDNTLRRQVHRSQDMSLVGSAGAGPCNA